VNWPGVVKPAVCRDLVDSTDFLPTLAALAGQTVPSSWKAEGVSFAPQLFGKKGHPRESVFFWYDPRPGWNKERFHRHIFVLDHNFKLFTDGRLFDIRGAGLREVQLDLKQLSPQAKTAQGKLRNKIDTMMKPPLSPRVGREVDTYGRPVIKKP
jgi:arylsulfatase A-like enzyme